jgi:hypothetical protein
LDSEVEKMGFQDAALGARNGALRRKIGCAGYAFSGASKSKFAT